MTETDKREQIARLEAKLRGNRVCWDTASGLFLHTGEWDSHANCAPATPHDTDAGRLAWMELLRMLVAPKTGGGWHVAWKPGGDLHSTQAQTLPEAITLAVEAAAEETPHA